MPTFLNKRYLLHESLGQGAMGIVYRATDRLSGEIVAIKRVTIPRENLQFTSRSNAKTTEDINLALAQEFQTLASLRHPNIISVVDYGFDDQRQPYFTMNYLPEAHTIIEAGQKLDETGKILLLIQVLQALGYLHRRNILHRDLKPANVLVAGSDLRVLDFGLSVSREQAQGRTGTLAYMAPEIIQRGQATEASDLYAVGVMAYQMFAGQLPFEALDLAGIISRPIESKKLNARPELIAVIERMLQKTPSERYQGAFESILAINNALDLPALEEDSAIRESFLQAAKFVGRDSELAQLLDGLDGAAHSRGSIWLVGSESGVGKTRLLKELRIRALVRGANVLRGQAIEDKGQPYQLWQEPLRRLALMGQINDLQASVIKTIVPDIETLLGREIPEVPELEDKDAIQRLSLIVGEIIKNGALALPPLVLLLEDLHWGRESLEMLAGLNRIIDHLPLLVIGTYRTEDVPDLPNQFPTMRSMLLPRFNSQAIAELSASMLGESGTQTQVLELLQNETEGNVFFLVETVRALAEEAGGLQGISHSTLPAVIFAGGVQEIIQRRLERVPEHFQPLLKLAAVTGRTLELELLQNVHPEIDLENWLTTCANVAVLEIQDERWRFAHDKLRETLLADFETKERQYLHNQAAAAIEAVYNSNLAPHYARLAGHHSQAGNLQKERVFAQLAGKQAAAQFSHVEAIRYFDQALKLTPENDLSARYDLLLEKREVYKLQGNPKKELENLETLQGIATALADAPTTTNILSIWASYYYDHGNYSAATDSAQQALNSALAIGDQEIALRAYNLIASTLWKQNEFESAALNAKQGLELAQQIGDRENEAMILNSLGMIAFGRRDLNAARAYFEQSLAIALENEYVQIQALSLNNLGMVAGYQGDFQAAQLFYEQALKLSQEMGARKQEAMNLVNLGWISGLLGEYERAINFTKTNIRIAREIGELYQETYGLINLSSYASACGETETALNSAEQARELARQIGDRSAEAWALTNLGHSYLSTQEFEQAGKTYQEALDIRKGFKQLLLATEPAAGLARALLEQGDLATAYQHVQSILPIIEQDKRLDGTDDPLRVYLACYLVLKAKDDDNTNRILKEAHDLIMARAANIPDQNTRKSFLEGITHHREILLAWQNSTQNA